MVRARQCGSLIWLERPGVVGALDAPRSKAGSRANESVPMPNQPIIVFDVNETLLDLETMRPAFDRLFDDPAAMRL